VLLIPCPWCGERDETEFNYGGRALKFPELINVDIGSWHRVIHIRDNPANVIRELWYHQSGCECWIQLSRNCLTHEITAASAEPLDGVEG
jgi:heterotetrameric sarcosine oxidase delta subunit